MSEEAQQNNLKSTVPETNPATKVVDVSSSAVRKVEVVHPKDARKRRRSVARRAKPTRSAAERAEERREDRARKARARRSRRAKEKSASKVAPPAGAALTEVDEVHVGRPKQRQGVVVSDHGEKTITVRVDIVRRHTVYMKVVRTSRTLRAHDERNEAKAGDVVRVVECRPMSRTKRWRLAEVLERAR